MRVVFQLLSVVVLFLSLTVAATGSANAFDLSQGRMHVTANIGSYHLNASREFDEVNPGLGLGMSFALNDRGTEFDAEVGYYRNSLGGGSYYVMGAFDTTVAEISPRTSIRMGVFGGLAHYPGDASKFKNRGVPTFGNWVMAAGAQATLRIDDRYDLRMRVMPAGKVADALFTLQVAAYF